MTGRRRRTALIASVGALAVGGGTAAAVLAAGDGSDGPTKAEQAAATSWRGFGVDHWPPASWRPYASSSPFNQPIAKGTRTHAESRAMIDQILSWSTPRPFTAGIAETRDDWGHPTYYAQPGDPLYTLRPTADWGTNPIAGKRIPIPAAARPAGGGDGHMTVVTPDGWEYDFWQVRSKPASGGTMTFTWGGRTRIDGNGLDSNGTASRFGNLAGAIRAQELAAGRIDHALFIAIRCTSPDRWFGYGVRLRSRVDSSFVYPAASGGAPCPSGTKAPPMGARLQLTMSAAQIDALDAPRWKKAILRAMARYGAFVGDTGGDGFTVMFESSTMYTAFGRPDPMVQLAQASGLRSIDGRYVFDLASGVDWRRYLRVVAPPKR